VLEQGMWKIRTNQELRGLHKDLDTIANTVIPLLRSDPANEFFG